MLANAGNAWALREGVGKFQQGAFPNFCSINTPAVADYRLLNVRQSWEEMSTVGSHEPGSVGSRTSLDVGRHLTDTEQGHTHKCTYYTELYTKTHINTY